MRSFKDFLESSGSGVDDTYSYWTPERMANAKPIGLEREDDRDQIRLAEASSSAEKEPTGSEKTVDEFLQRLRAHPYCHPYLMNGAWDNPKWRDSKDEIVKLLNGSKGLARIDHLLPLCDSVQKLEALVECGLVDPKSPKPMRGEIASRLAALVQRSPSIEVIKLMFKTRYKFNGDNPLVDSWKALSDLGRILDTPRMDPSDFNFMWQSNVDSFKNNIVKLLKSLGLLLGKNGIDVGEPVGNDRNAEVAYSIIRTANLQGLKRPAVAKPALDPTQQLMRLVRNNTRTIKAIDDALAAGADASYADPKTGRTPLHYAVKNCNSQIVKILLDAGAVVNVKDKNNITPVMEMVGRIAYVDDRERSGFSAPMLKALVDAGADVRAIDPRSGKSVIDALDEETEGKASRAIA